MSPESNFADVGEASQPQVKAGRLRPIAFTESKRTALAPELPTVEETLEIQDSDLAAMIQAAIAGVGEIVKVAGMQPE